MTPIRSELLARLVSDGFVPPEDAAPWSVEVRAAEFRAAVEAFAAAYWSLSPDERRERYNRLWNGRYGPGAARLGLLESGLNVIHAPADAPSPRSHGRLVRELDAIRRQAEVERYEEMRARTIVSDSPVYTPSAATGEVLIPRYSGFEQSVADARADWRVNRWLLNGVTAVGLVLVLMLLYVVFSDDRPRWRTTFTPTEVWSFQAYHNNLGSGTYTPQPAGYADWVAAGKPAARTP
ncbi:MAG: hypothetical protein U0804_04400 [Gemmataceae bacterium]